MKNNGKAESYLPEIHRLLPQSPDAEKGLIGSMLLSPEVIDKCIEEKFFAEHFHIPAHQIVFSALIDLRNHRQPTDFIFLTQTLKDQNKLNEAGGAALITDLFTFVPTDANAGYYMEIVEEKFTLRSIIKTCTEYASRSYDEQQNVPVIIDELEQKIFSIAKRRYKEKPSKTFREALHEKMDRIINSEPDSDLIPTGIRLLDVYSPLRLGDMPVIAAERKAGKSIMALNIALNVTEDGWPVLYFNLEDPIARAVDRIFAAKSRIPMGRHHEIKMDMEERTRVAPTITALSGCDLDIRDDIKTLVGIVTTIRKKKSENPELRLVVVDYLQLIEADSKKNESREQVVAKISRTLRLLSIELNLAILVLSQVNSDGATRESKAIEQDCTACWKLSRIFHKVKGEEEPKEELGKRMIGIPFQRNGQSGLSFQVTFLGEIARIEELARED